MAKPIPKTKPAPKQSAARSFAAQEAVETPATPKSRNRGAVLVKKTASQLHDLIGNTPIGVSNKELKAIVLAKGSAEILAKAGL